MEFITLQNIPKKLIKDTIVFPLKINYDDSSTLIETMRIDWSRVYGKKRKFFMQYCVTLPFGVAKDKDAWHFHNNQEDRFAIISGEIILVLADKRKGSPTSGMMNAFYMRADKSPYMVIVPKQVLHGILGVSKENAIILNFPTALYNPKDNINVPFTKKNFFLSKNIHFNWRGVKRQFTKYKKSL